VPKFLPSWVDPLSCQIFIPMSAKKIATKTNSKAAKPKQAKSSKSSKVSKSKAESKKATAKKSVSTKTSNKSKVAPSNSGKQARAVKKIAEKMPSPAKKVSSKKTTKTIVKKRSSTTSKLKSSSSKESSNLSKLKEVASQTISSNLQDSQKVESTVFSFEDALLFLKSKKKEKAKSSSKESKSDLSQTKVEKKTQSKSAKVKKLNTASIDDILGFGGPVLASARPLRDESKVRKEWIPFYNALMALRAALKGSIGERSSETIGASARTSGELSINSSDAGTETFDRDLALSMVANDQDALEEIEDALDRIFNGTYGVCLETNKPINKSRLKAVPFTRFSVEGQMQYERGKIKEKDFGSGSFATLADSTMGEEE
jgi:RNA polymerase-binding transcription factor DksA